MAAIELRKGSSFFSGESISGTFGWVKSDCWSSQIMSSVPSRSSIECAGVTANLISLMQFLLSGSSRVSEKCCLPVDSYCCCSLSSSPLGFFRHARVITRKRKYKNSKSVITDAPNHRPYRI